MYYIIRSLLTYIFSERYSFSFSSKNDQWFHSSLPICKQCKLYCTLSLLKAWSSSSDPNCAVSSVCICWSVSKTELERRLINIRDLVESKPSHLSRLFTVTSDLAEDLTALFLSSAGFWKTFVETDVMLLLANHPSEKLNNVSGSIHSSSCFALVLNQNPFTLSPRFRRALYSWYSSVLVSGYIALLTWTVCLLPFLASFIFFFVASPPQDRLGVQQKLFRRLVEVVGTVEINHDQFEFTCLALSRLFFACWGGGAKRSERCMFGHHRLELAVRW